jgi:hypothetical protein
MLAMVCLQLRDGHDRYVPSGLLTYTRSISLACRAGTDAQLVRQQAISLDEGVTGLDMGLGLVRAVDRDPAHARVLEIASSLTISAYDACYLATAEAMGSPLVTEDVRLLRLAPEIARSLASFGL